MRLQRVHRGYGLKDKLLLAMMRVLAGHAPGVVRTISFARRTAPLMPSSIGVSTTSEPNARRMWRRSMLMPSGITTTHR